MQGKIIKGIAGFYYVECDGNIYECKARGVFRNRSEKPLVGDFVEFIILEGQEGKGNIEKILPRTSKLIRPEVANVDQALIVFAAIDPAPDMHLLNRFLVNMEMMDIKSIICINKNDLKKEERIPEIYTKAGYKVICTSVKENEGIEEIREILSNKTTTVAGPSGVGKSSLINTVAGKKVMETGEISQKIKRGKNTTRHSELITIGKNSYILDTPGFASVDVPDMEKEDLGWCFPEFVEYIPSCKFSGCSHRSEPKCAVKEALEEGKICKERYDDYVTFFNEINDRRKW
ncbi:MAG: ribosome small subunit-dependent GTPase A [Lachnospiraceae bacterium]|nr:ribosome small subunit-dependent GTPase A [Lachnospiraceae bacterium]